MELLLLTVLFNLKKKDNEYKSYGGPFAFSENPCKQIFSTTFKQFNI